MDWPGAAPYDASVPPPPLPEAPADRLLRALRLSGLLPAARIDELVAGAPKGVARDPDKLGEYLVQRGAATHFQVTKLKQGTFQGLVLGPYHILSPLGKGGMGTVYLARDTRKPEGRRAWSPSRCCRPSGPARRSGCSPASSGRWTWPSGSPTRT